jgi:chemotaxis signal transduction protein
VNPPAEAAAPAATPAIPAERERAQAIDCGGVLIAVPYAWARTLVEDATLVSVPNAPGWLAGAANVEGQIVAVVDLARWADPEALAPAGRTRLLLGGEGDERLALRFAGLPQMVWVDAESMAGDAPACPPALQPFVRGSAGDAAQRWPLIDLASLARHWALELAA